MARVALYATARGLTIEISLGGGQDGLVMVTSRQTAVKSFIHSELYRREKAVYLRFQEKGFAQANEFEVPRLIEFDDGLWIIEMTIVSPPFIVDFAGATLNSRSSVFDDAEITREWLRDKQEEFEGDWPAVKRALWKFEGIGVYLNDVSPRNIVCR